MLPNILFAIPTNYKLNLFYFDGTYLQLKNYIVSFLPQAACAIHNVHFGCDCCFCLPQVIKVGKSSSKSPNLRFHKVYDNAIISFNPIEIQFKLFYINPPHVNINPPHWHYFLRQVYTFLTFNSSVDVMTYTTILSV